MGKRKYTHISEYETIIPSMRQAVDKERLQTQLGHRCFIVYLPAQAEDIQRGE